MRSSKDMLEGVGCAPSKHRIQTGPALFAAAAAMLLTTAAPAQNAPASVKMTMPASTPDPNGVITPERTRAYSLFRAITGIPVGIDDGRLIQMEAQIAAGNERAAAAVATSDPAFYDIRLRDLARRMSTREETVTAPVSDFVATFVGVARDGTDARELLRGNFYYRADEAKTMLANGTQDVRADLLNDFVKSNNHYADLQGKNYSLYAVLVRQDGQKIGNAAADAALDNPDPAGLITTRAFMAAHAVAGTNRRLVEYSFRQFMCVPMESWMDASRPDDMVGRDVDRFPGGSNEKYQVTCKACHTQMDGFRQAFAFVDFVNGNTVLGTAPVGKMNRNGDVFPEGYRTTGNTWLNYATAAKNTDQFGWRSQFTGTGISSFGRLLAESKGFSRCMTKQLFKDICKRPAGPAEEGVIRAIADEFEKDYKLKSLAEMVVVNPACIAKD